MLHKCFILGGILRTCSTHTSVACNLHDGRGDTANRYANQPKSVGLGDGNRCFCAICMENEAESKLFLHAYCYANGSDSSVSVSISLLVMTTSLGTNYVWNMAQR